MSSEEPGSSLFRGQTIPWLGAAGLGGVNQRQRSLLGSGVVLFPTPHLRLEPDLEPKRVEAPICINTGKLLLIRVSLTGPAPAPMVDFLCAPSLKLSSHGRRVGRKG